jgi:hypothetical protein
LRRRIGVGEIKSVEYKEVEGLKSEMGEVELVVNTRPLSDVAKVLHLKICGVVSSN